MSFRTIIFITLFTFLTPSLLSAKVKQTKLKLSTAKKVTIPKTIVTDEFSFKKQDSERFYDPSLGAVITYKDKKHPLMVVTYYIYPMDDENIPVEYLMSVQYESLKYQMEETHKYKGNTTVFLTESLHQVGNQETFYNKHNIVGEAGDLISETYLTHDQFHYLKLRISFPRFKASEYNSLSAKLADMLIGNTTVKEKKGTSLALIVSLPEEDTDKTSESDLTLNQLSYLISLSANIDPENLIHHFKQQLAVMESFASIMEEVMNKEGREENVLYIHDIKNTGHLDEYVWLNMRQKHWQEPDNLDIEAFHAWFDSHKNKKFYFRPNEGMVLLKFE